MIRVKISVEAFEAIAATLKLDSVGYENTLPEHFHMLWIRHDQRPPLSRSMSLSRTATMD